MDKGDKEDWSLIFTLMALIVTALGVGVALHPKNFIVGTLVVLSIAIVPALLLPPLNRGHRIARILIIIETIAIVAVFLIKTAGK